jgi:predicted membrane protein
MGMVCQAVVIDASVTKVTRVAPAADLAQPTRASDRLDRPLRRAA